MWGGTDNSGEVTVAGLSGGVLITETQTWAAAGYRQTVNAFSSITGVTTSGLAGEATPPSVQIRAIGHDGSPEPSLYEIVSGWPAQVEDNSDDWPAHQAGGRGQVGGPRLTVAYAEHWSPRPGDLAEDDLGRTWEVQSDSRPLGTVSAEVWWCRVRRHEQG